MSTSQDLKVENTPQHASSQTSCIKTYSPVDIKTICGDWQSGYYVLKMESDWIVVSKPYESNKTTQLTMPVAFPADRVRLTDKPEKLKVLGCYKSDNFLQDYGNKMIQWHGVVYANQH